MLVFDYFPPIVLRLRGSLSFLTDPQHHSPFRKTEKLRKKAVNKIEMNSET